MSCAHRKDAAALREPAHPRVARLGTRGAWFAWASADAGPCYFGLTSGVGSGPGRFAAAAFATIALLLVNVTVNPAAGAAVARVIVPVVATFPATTAGEKVTLAGCDKRTFTVPVTAVPLAVAVTVTVVFDVTAVDVAWNVTLV